MKNQIDIEAFNAEMAKQWTVAEVYIGGGVNFPFLSYCWAFYNETDGTYPIKGLTLEAMAKACAYIQANNGTEEFPWNGGDTEDRINACKRVVEENPELKDPYER